MWIGSSRGLNFSEKGLETFCSESESAGRVGQLFAIHLGHREVKVCAWTNFYVSWRSTETMHTRKVSPSVKFIIAYANSIQI